MAQHSAGGLPAPDTARVVALVSDLSMRLRARFLADDGLVDGEEQAALDLTDELADAAMEADDGRKAAIMLLNCGDVTAWQRRQWRERAERRRRPPAA